MIGVLESEYIIHKHIYYTVLKFQNQITRTIVALFGLPELSLIFLGGMGIEVTSLKSITSLDNGPTTCFQVSLKFSSYSNTCHSPITIIVWQNILYKQLL